VDWCSIVGFVGWGDWLAMDHLSLSICLSVCLTCAGQLESEIKGELNPVAHRNKLALVESCEVTLYHTSINHHRVGGVSLLMLTIVKTLSITEGGQLW